jgi:peroxiredoxin
MFSVKYWIQLSILLLFFASCNQLTDDLLPDGTDKRMSAQNNVPSAVGKIAPDFSLSDSKGNAVSLYTELSTTKGAVLYFTMWCSVCNAHLENMTSQITPSFPNIKFFVVDYVSGSTQGAADSLAANGFQSLTIPVLIADAGLVSNYQVSMGIVVVIDENRVVLMHEYYEDGARLRQILEAIQ